MDNKDTIIQRLLSESNALLDENEFLKKKASDISC
jgi:hypothetical protein